MNEELQEDPHFKDLIEEHNLNVLKTKGDRLDIICRQQFYLAYSAHISITDSDEMSVGERDLFYRILKKQLDDEKEMLDAAEKKRQEQMASKPKPRKR